MRETRNSSMKHLMLGIIALTLVIDSGPARADPAAALATVDRDVLPPTFRPASYDLHLNPDIAQLTFPPSTAFVHLTAPETLQESGQAGFGCRLRFTSIWGAPRGAQSFSRRRAPSLMTSLGWSSVAILAIDRRRSGEHHPCTRNYAAGCQQSWCR